MIKNKHKKIGRPNKKKGKGTGVCIYLTDPFALRIHQKLSDRNEASRRYEQFLLREYNPFLSQEEKLQVLIKEIVLLQKIRDSKISQIDDFYEFKIMKIQEKIEKLHEIKKESEQKKNLMEIKTND